MNGDIKGHVGGVKRLMKGLCQPTGWVNMRFIDAMTVAIGDWWAFPLDAHSPSYNPEVIIIG